MFELYRECMICVVYCFQVPSCFKTRLSLSQFLRKENAKKKIEQSRVCPNGRYIPIGPMYGISTYICYKPLCSMLPFA